MEILKVKNLKGAFSNPIPMIMRSSEHMQQIRTALVGMPQPSATLTRLQSSEDAHLFIFIAVVTAMSVSSV